MSIVLIRSAKKSRSKTQAMERGLEHKRDRTMTVLTYRGKKYIQNKQVFQHNEPVLLTYRGLEVMSKRIHEAATAEMG